MEHSDQAVGRAGAKAFGQRPEAAVKIGLEEASVVGIKVGEHSQSPHLWSHTGQESAWGAGTCQGPVGLVLGLQGRESQEVGGSHPLATQRALEGEGKKQRLYPEEGQGQNRRRVYMRK